MTDGTTEIQSTSESELVVPPGSEIRRISGGRKMALRSLAMIARLWCSTLRFEVAPLDLKAGRFCERPVVILLWHNRLFVVPFLLRFLRSRRPATALISASRDGAWLSSYFAHVGIPAIRGSSSRLGRAALRQLIAEQRAGRDVAITPDGPRGPKYDMKPGALLTARWARSPLILIGVQFHRAWRMSSWDEFNIPWPFSRVTVRCEQIAPEKLPHGQVGLAQLRRRLLVLSGEESDQPPTE